MHNNNQPDKPEVTPVEVEPIEVTTLATNERAQIDVQVATAQANPRSVDGALKEALTLATLDPDTAKTMFYALKRGNKLIEGPGVRLAEVLAYSWRNVRVDCDIESDDGKHVTAVATFMDLERNVGWRARVTRRVVDKKGRRYTDDMIGVTKNAAMGVAKRNVVFAGIPRPFVDRIYEAAQSASTGKGTIKEKRERAFAWFAEHGATDAQVFKLLGVDGMDDVNERQIIILAGIVNSIKEGETTLKDLLRGDRTKSDAAEQLDKAAKETANAPVEDNTTPADIASQIAVLMREHIDPSDGHTSVGLLAAVFNATRWDDIKTLPDAAKREGYKLLVTAFEIYEDADEKLRAQLRANVSDWVQMARDAQGR